MKEKGCRSFLSAILLQNYFVTCNYGRNLIDLEWIILYILPKEQPKVIFNCFSKMKKEKDIVCISRRSMITFYRHFKCVIFPFSFISCPKFIRMHFCSIHIYHWMTQVWDKFVLQLDSQCQHNRRKPSDERMPIDNCLVFTVETDMLSMLLSAIGPTSYLGMRLICVWLMCVSWQWMHLTHLFTR